MKLMFRQRTMNKWKALFRKIGSCRLFLIVIIGLVLFSIHASWSEVRRMLELHKCPACFGVSLCSHLLSVDPTKVGLVLNAWGPRGWVFNVIATKNVFSAHLNGDPVIVKRLGSTVELQEFDDRICRVMECEPNCENKMRELVHRVHNLRESVRTLLAASSSMQGPGSHLQVCPSTTHVDLLFSNVLPQSPRSHLTKLGNDEYSAYIWTTLQINPEPLLMQIMRAEDGWPVPRYIGSCGRIVVMQDAGTSLIHYHGEPWPVRAGLALQLLLAADRFTYAHPYFAFYLLDISPDNIAVSKEGKLSFIDLEHVVVLDRHPPPSEKPESWNDTHSSEVMDDCPGCYTFSLQDLCSYHISDHNHFTICQQLLAPGLASKAALLSGGMLHSVPSQIAQQYPQIASLLLDCASNHSTDRVRSARRLRDLLHIASKENPMFRDSGLLETWKYS